MQVPINEQQQLVEEFEQWIADNDPNHALSNQQQADLFLKYKKNQLGYDDGNCDIEMGLVATKSSADDLNDFLKIAGVKDDLQVGQGIKMRYKINLGLTGLVPTNHDGLQTMLDFFEVHPDSFLVSKEDGNKLLDSLDQWVAEAEAWHALVANVTKSFNKVFMLNEMAANKAVHEANKNEVVIE